MRGILETQLDVSLNKKINDSIRASVLSLKSLVSRLISSAYLMIAGGLIANGEFLVLMVIAAVLIAVLGTISLTVRTNNA